MNARLNVTREIVLGVRNVSLILCCVVVYVDRIAFAEVTYVII